MNRVDIQQAGGFPLETDTLDFLQKSYTALQSLVALGGDNFIISGCIVAGSNVSDGWVVINGELLPFRGSALQTKVVVRETPSGRIFENGQNKVVFYDRYAQFGTGETFILFNDLVRIKDLKTFRNLPHVASSAINSPSEDTLATSKAVKDVYDALKSQLPAGSIIMWGGLIAEIPAGFWLCDGQNGRPDLRDKFILGAGNAYPVGAVGGEKEHQLTVEELPQFRLHFPSGGDNRVDDVNSDLVLSRQNEDGRRKDIYTNYIGGNEPHNNMPEYIALAFITNKETW